MADLSALVRRGVVTTDLAEAAECCGMPRDEDGFCVHRPGHPVFVSPAGSPIPQLSITCPLCGMTSYHPEDIRQGYCGNCHAFTRGCTPAQRA